MPSRPKSSRPRKRVPASRPRAFAHPPAPRDKRRSACAADDPITATIIVRRRPGGRVPKSLAYFSRTPPLAREVLSREKFEAQYGASVRDLEQVAAFARAQQLEVTEVHRARRTVVVHGSVATFSATFGVKFYNYELPRGLYRGYQGALRIPAAVAGIIEAIVGLDNRPVPASHHGADPTPIRFLTPHGVASLYNFPAGTGAGETIGIYEMATSDRDPGYLAADLTATMAGFGPAVAVPVPIDVSVGGQSNAGVSDTETVLDICVAAGVAQGATLAVYFTGDSVQGIIQCLQRMIHPNAGDPVPSVISISYGWSADDSTDGISDDEYQQMSALFQDAAHLFVTVIVSTGDVGAGYRNGSGSAQASYPATDPWVLACGGTSVGNFTATGFDEFVWNDTWTTKDGGSSSGATGGGISARFPVPDYQRKLTLPTALASGFSGRGIPDVAGNASPNSGYKYTVNGSNIANAGTSAVPPLYAGLVAIMNALLRAAGSPAVGFANPTIYQSSGSLCHDVTAASGPTDNSYNGVTGYSAGKGWDACTGWGSIDGDLFLEAHRPLTAKIQRRTSPGCDPGAVAGTMVTYDAITTGGFSPLSFHWLVTFSRGVLRGRPKGMTFTGPEITVKAPPAGSAIHMTLTVTDPFGASATSTGGDAALDPTFALFLESLCRLIHITTEHGPPVHGEPGDPLLTQPYSIAALQSVQAYARRIADLSTLLLNAAANPGIGGAIRRATNSTKNPRSRA